MRALLSKAVGQPEDLVLEEVPDLVAGPGEIVITIKAAAVNFPDALMVQDMYQFKPPRPFAPGGEVAGVVKSVGEGVTRVKPGDRVLASTGFGGFAEEAKVAEAGRVYAIPDAMPFDEAASLLMTYGTSHYALKDRAAIKPGETLLVLGAAGGVGLAAVELGKAMGATVIAAASSQEKVDFAKAAGADIGLVYPRTLDKEAQRKLSDDIKRLGGGGVDVVYDGVGGDYAEPAIRAMNWDGRFLVIGFPAGIPKVPLNLTLLKSCQIVGVFWGAFVARDPKANAENIADLFRLYEQGKIKPRVSKRYPLSRGAEAIRELMDRNAQGKIVVVPE
ncbi:MAG: NADPH:quinone oxidoreductase family protein [Hyphomonadaceae bacterium]|nr:NADPH:quinone oxidoreductase family protein [Hyphomonadaceae bacterium]